MKQATAQLTSFSLLSHLNCHILADVTEPVEQYQMWKLCKLSDGINKLLEPKPNLDLEV